MPSAEARITVDRPQRYLRQLCDHAAAVEGGGAHAHPAHSSARSPIDASVQVRVDRSGDAAVVTFGPWGSCSVRAAADTLTLRVDATDEAARQRIQDILTADLERFGRRANLAVVWHVPTGPILPS